MRIIFCLFSLILLLSTANASVITVEFSGSITQVPLDEVFGDIVPGEQFLGAYFFDSSAIDQIPNDPNFGTYSWGAPLGMTVTIGAHQFIANGSFNIGTLNGAVDQFTALAASAAGDITLELFLQDNTGSALSNDHLPLTPLPPGGFAQRDFHLIADLSGGQLQVDGQLSASQAASAPEPSPALLILAGSAFLLAGRRRV